VVPARVGQWRRRLTVEEAASYLIQRLLAPIDEGERRSAGVELLDAGADLSRLRYALSGVVRACRRRVPTLVLVGNPTAGADQSNSQQRSIAVGVSVCPSVAGGAAPTHSFSTLLPHTIMFPKCGLQHLYSRALEYRGRISQEKLPVTLPVDVGILTIIPAEIEAIFTALGIDREEPPEGTGALRYWRTSIISRLNDRALNLAVSFVAGTAGNVESAISTTLMLEILKPRLMCLVGIAAGAPGKTCIGDVVVPDVVHDVTVTVRKDRKTQPRRRSYELDGRLIRSLKLRPLDTDVLKGRLLLEASIYEALVRSAESAGLTRSDIAHPPGVRDGSLVSGNTLLRDSRYFPDFHSSNDERCRAAEMEAAGFARACALVGCPWFIVRGISDYGDSRKDDSFHRYAAHTASTVLREFLQEHFQIEDFPRLGTDRETLFTDSLEQSLSDESQRQNSNYVVEIGRFLSRPLWLSGKLEMRKRIGELVEDSAAACGRDLDRARALIDDIGWTSAVLKDFGKARKAIKDGFRLAREGEDWYLCAKANRHLASIARNQTQLHECEARLDEADMFASQIGDQALRNEMAISLLVSRAKLLLSRGEHKRAIELLESARAKYRSTGDQLREVKVFHPLGHAKLALGDRQAAIGVFAEGYDFAIQCGRKDEALGNAAELALLLRESEDEGASEWARRAVRLSSELGDSQLPIEIIALSSSQGE
jgi:nucleoside phosphorylase/tetratricopeptide (TPR) repeat protein